MSKNKARPGTWAVVMRVFGDGSSLVRVGENPDEGQDLALGATQMPDDPQPGEAGRLIRRKVRLTFERNQVGLVWSQASGSPRRTVTAG